ncbi:MAG TPA: GNAT family protein [Kofleriaceae bacterium]|jgi:RimJ/RimL family protein N-acetyltransferase
MPELVTERLRLVPITLAVVEAFVRGDRAAAEACVGARLPDEWPNEDLIARAFPFSLDAIRVAPDVRLWGDSLVLLRDPPPRIVGSVVFHGRPTDGIAEVGYGVEEGSRGSGLATEATLACLEWALAQPGITAVRATTFPWHAASLAVIRKCGMVPAGTRPHELFGELLVFERVR